MQHEVKGSAIDLVCGFLLGAMLVATPGMAGAEEPIPIHVEVDSPAPCSGGELLVRAIERRTPRIRAVPGSEAAVLVRAEVDATGHRGRVHISGLEHESRREVEAADCEEVLDALALITAMALDPELGRDTEPTQAPVRAPDGSVAGSHHESPAASTADRPARPSRSEPVPRSVAPPGVHAKSPGAERRPGALGFFAGGLATSAVAPRTSFGALLGIDVALPGPVGGVALRAQIQRSFSPTWRTPIGDAHFTWTALRATLSPARWPRSTALGVRPCLFGELGVIEGTGMNTFLPETAHTPWGAVGAVGRLEAVPSRAFSVEIEGGVVLPLVRDDFYFDPETRVFAVPALGFTSAFALVGRF